MIYRFGDCEFDVTAFELRCKGAVIDASPQVLSILKFMLVSRSRLVTKDELVDEIWGGEAISDAAITVRIRALRQAIGDSGTEQKLLKTVRGRGFRFVGDVTFERRDAVLARAEAGNAQLAVGQSEGPAVGPSTKPSGPPSVAVLPLRILSAGEEAPQNGRSQLSVVAEALPDDILTALSHLHELAIIARGSSFRFPSYDHSLKDIAGELGADYCLSGAVESFGNHYAVSFELADTKTETILWRNRSKFEPEEVHSLRGELVDQVASELSKSIEKHELARAQLMAPDILDSWHALHIGLNHLNTFPTPQFAEAQQILAQAVHADPGYARARAALAHGQFFGIMWGTMDDETEYWVECQKTARHAFELDPYDPLCNLAMGRVHSNGGDLALSRKYIELAVESAPNYALALSDLSRIQIMDGQIELGKQTLAQVERLDPQAAHPESTSLTHIIIEIMEQNFSGAADRAIRLSNYPGISLRTLAAMLIAMHFGGKTTEAAKLSQRIKKRFSRERLQRHFSAVHFGRPELIEIVKHAAQTYDLT